MMQCSRGTSQRFCRNRVWNASDAKPSRSSLTMQITENQIQVLSAVCDAFVPSVDRDDADGFFRRKASDIGLPQILAGALSLAPEQDQAEFFGLLDLLGSVNLGA